MGHDMSFMLWLVQIGYKSWRFFTLSEARAFVMSWVRHNGWRKHSIRRVMAEIR